MDRVLNNIDEFIWYTIKLKVFDEEVTLVFKFMCGLHTLIENKYKMYEIRSLDKVYHKVNLVE